MTFPSFKTKFSCEIHEHASPFRIVLFCCFWWQDSRSATEARDAVRHAPGAEGMCDWIRLRKSQLCLIALGQLGAACGRSSCDSFPDCIPAFRTGPLLLARCAMFKDRKTGYGRYGHPLPSIELFVMGISTFATPLYSSLETDTWNPSIPWHMRVQTMISVTNQLIDS